MRHKWDGRVIKGCTDMKQEMLGIRRVRRDEESRLESRIIMIKPIEVRGEDVVKQGNTRTVLVKIHESKSKVLSWRWPRQDPWLAFDHSISSYLVGTVLLHPRLSRSKTPIF